MIFTACLPAFWLAQSDIPRGDATRLRIRLPLTMNFFLQFSFYCIMRLFQFNIYFNHHFHIFMLSYITR